jgi:hypothetical protein
MHNELLEDFGTAHKGRKRGGAIGAAKHRPDPRDWILAAVTPRPARTRGRKQWRNPIRLQQETEGACVGGGWLGHANSEPNPNAFPNDLLFAIYRAAQKRDPWPGEDYEGTSVKAGADVVRLGLVPEVGVQIRGYAVTRSVETVALHILNVGPVVIGVDWDTGMDEVDDRGYVHPLSGKFRGGHCVVLDGVEWGTPRADRCMFPNTWGKEWGFNGRGKFHATDLQALLSRPGAIAVAAVEV